MRFDVAALRGQRALAVLALALTLLFLWSLNYEYRGLVYDAQIYAVQALAKIRPSLRADLFLQNVSQDRFTVFPRVYAWCIQCVGLRSAALLLTIVSTLWLLSAAWVLVSTLANRAIAWLATCMMIIVPGHYGAFAVFYVLEPFMTARLPAEAMVITALICHLKGFRRAALLVACSALAVHPLMALPGVLLLACLQWPPRTAAVGAGIGIIAALATAVAASRLTSIGRFLPVMDAAWLEVVRERSQFLFLQLWTRRDWALNARPFISLACATLILREARSRHLAIAAMIVGAAGLSIAAIGSLIGPIAILMQGQAWRWVWVTSMISVLLLVPTVQEAWTDRAWEGAAGEAGTACRACAVLLVAGWALPVEAGTICVSLALLLRVAPIRLPSRFAPCERIAVAAILLATGGWALQDSGVVLSRTPSGSAAFLLARVRALPALEVWCVMLVGAVWYWMKATRGAVAALRPSAVPPATEVAEHGAPPPTAMPAVNDDPAGMRAAAVPIALCIALASSTTFLLFLSASHVRPYGSASDLREFAQWRDRIPPESTVFVTNGYDSGSFVWFTLERNNYLSSGQSAGVVFSRATALEVQRRSQVLLPLADPNWKMLSSLRNSRRLVSSAAASGSRGAAGARQFRPLTAQSLVAACRDPVLGFVVSPDDVGFDPVRHTQAGLWKNWNLYECSHVRAARAGST
ncbi:MAG: hypothetical protein M3N97_13505 [Pseudomonadota bacterium]|nr:hypothetical protein [Pseudomonadota bacterium]